MRSGHTDRHTLALAAAVVLALAGTGLAAASDGGPGRAAGAALAGLTLVAVVAYGRALVRQARDIKRLLATAAAVVPPESVTPEDLRTRLAALGKADDRRQRELAALVKQSSVDVGALLNLHKVLPVAHEVPAAGGWAAQPEVLLALVTAVLERRPRVVLELGSGASTVWLATALTRTGGRLVSVEHDPVYAALTREALRRNGVDGVVDLREAPLVDVAVGDATHRWYDAVAVADLSDVGLLFIDGPPESTAPLARYPALPLTLGALAPGAIVVLDDHERADEQEAIGRWRAELPDGLALRDVRRVGRAMFWELDSADRLAGVPGD